MRLNVQTDFALRVMMHLAVNPDRHCTIADIAARYGISKNHLMKVAHHLGQEGFVETLRGRSGGLKLARPADQINLGAIVRAMEADFAIVECFENGAGECLITPACKLKSVLKEAVSAFLNVLDGYTLDHLVRRNSKLRFLLEQDAA